MGVHAKSRVALKGPAVVVFGGSGGSGGSSGSGGGRCGKVEVGKDRN